MRYPVESFTSEERELLAPHFTNLDRPVFALVNLPETVKGALFARYSRYSGTVRRLFLEEFAADAAPGERPFDGAEGERAAKLYERVFLGYGDDSIAQVGGAHIACEWVSNVLTKVLQRGRLAAYLEQSTRYIPYDKPLPEDAGGGYRYYRDDELGPEFAVAMDELFAIYSRSLGRVEAWAAERWPRGDDEPEGPWRRSIRAKALDLLRGLLPAATLSHVGIYASGQAYEQMLLRLMASPLPEAREYGGMILGELQQVMPSFVARVERPDRGGEWVEVPGAAPRGDRALGLAARPRPPRRRRGHALGRAGPRRRDRGGPARLLHVRVGGDAGDRDPRPARRAGPRGARGAPRRHGGGAGQPPPPTRPRFRGAALPLRDRLRLRRLPRPPAPPDADLPVAAAGAGPRGRGPGRGRARPGSETSSSGPWRSPGPSTSALPRPGCATPPPTRSASPTGSATCSTSTPARRCT